MKKKILVPMFASVMALSMNAVVDADEVKDNNIDNKEEKTSQDVIDIGEYEETTYKTAVVKDGVATKIRNAGKVKLVAYTGDSFKVLATQGEWVEVSIDGEKGWVPSRFVDIKSAPGFIIEESVNFRKDANIDSEIIEELSKGMKLEVLEDQGEWIKVKYSDNEGYVNSKYISDEAPVIEEVVVEQTNTSTNTDTSANTNRVSNSQNSNNKNNTSSNKIEQSNENIPSANTSLAQAVVNLAYSKIGSPYVWGAEGPNSFDCSGLTYYVYKQAAGISLPRTSTAQSTYGKTVSKSNLQPGDLVFFGSNGSVNHVGIYIGGGDMIHSPKPGETVKITSINSSYYSGRFITAKRVL